VIEASMKLGAGKLRNFGPSSITQYPQRPPQQRPPEYTMRAMMRAGIAGGGENGVDAVAFGAVEVILAHAVRNRLWTRKLAAGAAGCTSACEPDFRR
jgi:hypothetical protein